MFDSGVMLSQDLYFNFVHCAAKKIHISEAGSKD
jgi:hypothetical protein